MAEGLPEGTVTVLFTDVEGSTDLTTSRGDEAAQDILRAQRELVRRQISEHEGYEVKGTGDGFMVAFGSARRAVACAIGIQRAIDEHNRQQPPEQRARVRVGMNTGEVIREEADLFGAAVNAAARIAAKADGSQILVSETVKSLLGPAKDVQFADRGRFRLKGFPERWRLYEVIWQKERPASAAPVAAERTPYVGRESERTELRRLLEQAIRGQGALAMIGGEPGVGKTRLSEELMAEAGQRGLTTLIGHCYEMEGAPPYIPFVEMLEATARTATPEGFRAALGDAAAEVARIMPELRRLFPDIPAPLDLPPEQERRYLFNSLREFVDRASRVNPLLLVLDDLHWGDDSTLLLLEHIAQQLGQMPVLIIGTYRDVELDVGRPLARTLESLLRQRLAHRIALKRLPQAGVEAMLLALSGQAPPSELVQVVYSETEGNPFFVEEVFQHLSEEGKLFDSEGRWRADLAVSELDVPEGVRLVISRRLQRVSEECRRELTAAAVIGRAFSFELLEALGETGADALLDAVDEAERAQLITATSEGLEARFTFAHELIRQTLISGLSLPRRQRLHLRVAEAMERAYSRNLEERAADLAHHLYQAGAAADADKTTRYLVLAAERAYAAAAFEDALRLYESALSLQPQEGPERADLLFRRGLARRSLGRWDEALSDWREALAGFEAAGDDEEVGRLCRGITEQLNWGGRFAESLEISRRGLIALGQRQTADRCRLLSFGGLALSLGGFYAAGAGMVAEAVAMAEGLADQRLLGETLGNKAIHHWCYAETRELLESATRAVDLSRAHGDLWSLAQTLGFLQNQLLFIGRFDEASEMAQELELVAGRIGHLGAQMLAQRDRGFMQVAQTGDLSQFQKCAKEDMEFCRSANLPWISGSHTWLGVARFLAGEWDEETIESFREGARLAPPGILVGQEEALLLVCLAYAGRGDEALQRLRQPVGDLPRPGQANGLGARSLLLGAVEALTMLGERAEAAKLYPLVLEAIETGVVWRGFDHRLVQLVAGMAAAAGGQWEQAEEHYQAALRQAHELPVKHEQPEVRRFYARMLLDRGGPGDREKARQLLEEAIAMYQQIGMPKHLELAQALLREV